MRSKLHSICIVAVFLLLGNAKVYAQEFVVNNDDGVPIHYRVLSSNNFTVTVCGNRKDYKGIEFLVIPEVVKYNGTWYRVTEIAANAFGSWNSGGCGLTSVSFPSTLKRIGEAAFCGNDIAKIVLPEGLEEIGKNAFFDNYRVKDINIPNSVKIMEKHVFGYSGAFNMARPVKDVNIDGLPPYVTPSNCEYYGIKKSEVEKYYANHPKNFQLIYQSPQNPQPIMAEQKVAQLDYNNQPEVPGQPVALSSDVDINIPLTRESSENTFAIIFANEDYQEEAKVDFALNDGESFKQYCHKSLGIPESNIHFRKNATLNNIRMEMDWIKKVAHAYDGQAQIIAYYAGHGIPDEKTGAGYLLPIDGSGSSISTGYSLTSLYTFLGELPAKSVIVFIDACFSGSKRGEGMLASARGVAIKAKAQTPKGKMIVFSAAQGDETAYPYKEKQHGLFTYFLLKKLQETKGDVSLKDLSDYLMTQVKRKSIVENSKSQTPTVGVSTDIQNIWQSMRLK